MKNYETEDSGGRIVCKDHGLIRCYDCEYVAELEEENKIYKRAFRNIENVFNNDQISNEMFICEVEDIIIQMYNNINNN